MCSTRVCTQHCTEMHLRGAGTRNCAHNLRARRAARIYDPRGEREPRIQAAEGGGRFRGEGSRNAAPREKPAL